jgi:anti-anti-sigma regulatory factor
MQPGVGALIHVTATDRGAGIRLVQVEGDLHARDAARFRRSLLDAGAVAGHRLIVDLRGCRFVDGRCASAVSEVADQLRRRSGTELRLVTSPESVLDLALEGAWRSRLWIHHTVGEALTEAGPG